MKCLYLFPITPAVANTPIVFTAQEEAGKEPNSLGFTERGCIISTSSGLVDGTTLQIPTPSQHTINKTTAYT